MMKQAGKVYLIGAGPGDIELLTLKAARVLQEADVILMDNLVNREILSYARPDATVIEVGKRGGKPSSSQEAINNQLVTLALEGKCVARIKGGDPFVFGRGGEEVGALTEAGIEVTVIPGITSGIAVPGILRIPLTHRYLSQSVVFATGSSREGGMQPNWRAIAESGSTIVLYMALTHFEEIARQLMAHGVSPECPCAAVQDGTLARQSTMLVPLVDMVSLVTAGRMKSPTIFVIGEVVAQSPLWNESEPQVTLDSNSDRNGRESGRKPALPGAAAARTGKETAHR
ncbi:MAG: uroporphyrinogen-III C-methyltransferase [Candidatus Obscuribacterales bacterium]|nr:uroporphyrinogen-III C-methyltransferase [Candidatus Obscuribacterales bacterium]